MPFSLLFLDADAVRLGGPLSQAVAGLRVTPCTSLVAARAHLSGTAFDAILAAADLPDGPAISLLDGPLALPPMLVRAASDARATEAEAAGARLGFVDAGDPRVLGALVAWSFGLHAPDDDALASGAPEASGETDPDPTVGASAPEAATDVQAVLGPIRDEMSRITHDLNNPLAVIAGNVQLVRELMAVAPEDEMIPTSVADIGIAAGELVALVDQITALRRQIDAALDA
ncbi:MAG: histidine kinase dimerization/phospho-acceptor domain-containing protein [Bacteroidota bacterium]